MYCIYVYKDICIVYIYICIVYNIYQVRILELKKKNMYCIYVHKDICIVYNIHQVHQVLVEEEDVAPQTHHLRLQLMHQGRCTHEQNVTFLLGTMSICTCVWMVPCYGTTVCMVVPRYAWWYGNTVWMVVPRYGWWYHGMDGGTTVWMVVR